jgi:hypothetical protein
MFSLILIEHNSLTLVRSNVCTLLGYIFCISVAHLLLEGYFWHFMVSLSRKVLQLGFAYAHLHDM